MILKNRRLYRKLKWIASTIGDFGNEKEIVERENSAETPSEGKVQLTREW